MWVGAMWQAANQALDEATEARGQHARTQVRALAVSGQQHGLVALDVDLRVIRPAKLWCDTESAPEAEELSKSLALPIVASHTASKLLWLKRHEPEAWARLHRVALPHDFLNLALTGTLRMEPSDASGTGLLDVTGLRWDEAAAALVDEALLGKLPPLIRAWEWVGTLESSAARELGLAEGLPVGPGGGDNAMSALGCGCTCEGRVAVSLGTSGTVFGRAPAAARDPTGTVCAFLDAAGGGLPLVCTLNCGTVPEEVRAGYAISLEEIQRMAEDVAPGCEGVTFVPFLAGERTPNLPTASGTILGIRAGHLASPGLLYRAALEGTTFALKAGLEVMQQHGLPKPISQLRLVGGGSRSALWRRVVADAFNAEVACPVEAESAALGAALQAAGVDAGAKDLAAWILENHDAPVSQVISPDPEGVAALQEANRLYSERVAQLHGRSTTTEVTRENTATHTTLG